MVVHERSIIVNAPVHEVFARWRNFEDFPNFMSHVKEVKILGEDLSHWKGKVDGFVEEWDARMTKVEPDKIIVWESTQGFQNRGEVRFEPVDSGTKVTVHFEYEPPAGVIGEIVERVYMGREFERDLEEDLRNFKVHVEEVQRKLVA
jgi:uncharacterized membrane protein